MNLEKPNATNPYQPPTSTLSPPPIPLQRASLFYVVSKKKFFILFVSTFSIYSIYWFWRQWRSWQQATGEKLWPIARAIFFIFFTHSLFSEMTTAANKEPDTNNTKLSTMATIYVIASLAFNYMDNIDLSGVLYSALNLLFIGIMSLTMWQAQAQANIASFDATDTSNEQLTIANYLWIVLGILFWLLVIIGTFIPDTV